MIISTTVFCVAAVGATVWTVLAVPANSGGLVDALILTSILLWVGGFSRVPLFTNPRRLPARSS